MKKTLNLIIAQATGAVMGAGLLIITLALFRAEWYIP